MTPATQRYKVRPYAIKAHEVVVFCGGTTLAEFYSMADSSTTVRGIPIRIAGGCWARRQLRNSIRYVPMPSKPMMLLSFVEVVPWRNSTRRLIPPQWLEGFQFGLREVVELDASYEMI